VAHRLIVGASGVGDDRLLTREGARPGGGYLIQEHGHGSRGAPFQVLSHVFEADGQITRSRFQNVGSTYGVILLNGECRTR
jgi:hypothetical protein